jgi:hypothetical protein
LFEGHRHVVTAWGMPVSPKRGNSEFYSLASGLSRARTPPPTLRFAEDPNALFGSRIRETDGDLENLLSIRYRWVERMRRDYMTVMILKRPHTSRTTHLFQWANFSPTTSFKRRDRLTYQRPPSLRGDCSRFVCSKYSTLAPLRLHLAVCRYAVVLLVPQAPRSDRQSTLLSNPACLAIAPRPYQNNPQHTMMFEFLQTL